MKKAILLAAVAALFVGMIALPSAADDPHTAVVAFHGRADVSPGLLLPTVANKTYGDWSFESVLACVSTLGNCSISAAGDLAPGVAGIGAACGMSHGYNGIGSVKDAGGTTVYSLEHVGWVVSVGGTLPLDGTYTHAATGDKGGLIGAVQAQGATGCLGGAEEFTVVGVAAAL